MFISNRDFDRSIGTIVFKVAERCNMACPYCFMFNGADKTYRRVPAFVSDTVIDILAYRIQEQLEDGNGRFPIDLTLHGGEPLLLPINLLKHILSKFSRLDALSMNLQTNATLITDEHLALFRDFPVRVGTSLDGYPELQNRRLMKNGTSSYGKILSGLEKLLTLSDAQFKGVLCVMDTDSDPGQVYEHFLSLGINRMDFLFPLRNHSQNYGYCDGMHEYFDWLQPILDQYFTDDSSQIEVRLFDSIVELLVGSDAPMCALEGSAIDMLTIDTDGSIQLIDDLRAIKDGYVDLGLNISQDPLNSFFNTDKVKEIYHAEQHLPHRCEICKWKRVCGSGGHAFRWTGSDFNKPSIYCNDIFNLIETIAGYVYE